MSSYAMRQPAPATRRWPVSAIAMTALAAAAIMVGACGSPAPPTDIPPSPAPTATEPAGPAGSAALEPAPPEPEPVENPGTGDNSEPAPPPEPLQIEVDTSAPTASYPCHPSGTIVVSGGTGNSAELPDSDEYPVEVTYQWFVRKADPEQNPVPFGQPGTLQFNVAGGIPVSGPELNPAPEVEVELRVVAPETISGGWITHPGCV